MAKNNNLQDFLIDVANAIRNKKGTTALINPQDFSSEIESIESGGETPSADWQPNEDMKWAKSICENDVQDGFTYKVLQMISDGYVYTDIVVPSGGAVKTSDGGYYTANAKHTWDDTNSRVATSHNGMKLRWLIYYYTGKTPGVKLLTDVMYACFDRVKFSIVFKDKHMLEYFDIINGADLSSVTNITQMFQNCYSLQAIPLLNTSSVTNMNSMFKSCYSLQAIPLLDTSSATDVRYMFSNCYSLQTIPLLDTSSATTMSAMFQNCYSLQTIPLLNTSSVTSMSSMFQSCYSLQTIPLLDTSRVANISSMFVACYSLQAIPLLNTSSVTNISQMFQHCSSLQAIPLLNTSSVTSISNMFYNCSSLQTIPLLDTSRVTSMNSMFQSCSYLEFLTMTNIKASFNISASTKFSQETLEALIDNLVDLTGKSARTFTMGTTNLAKVSQEKKDLATAKNWSLK